MICDFGPRTADPFGQTVKLHYYADTDSLYIELKKTPGTETREVAPGLVVDLGEEHDALASMSFCRRSTVSIRP
jgi:uncharacterized protein YuzE